MITKTKYFSYSIGELPLGCQYCVKGQKTVIFITGLCAKHCFYCPISEIKKDKDVVYVNERPIKNENDFKAIFEEAESHNSKGAGITGGDPLLKIERTLKYIRTLKQHFGNKYHVHLYTPLKLVTEKNLKELYEAGLDEIRFHLEIKTEKEQEKTKKDDNKIEKIKLAEKFSWDYGIEIPIFPDKEKETKEIINYVKDKVKFINLNELEYSDTNQDEFKKRNYLTKDDTTYAIKRSKDTALKILKYIDKEIVPKEKINVHFCTAQLKDKAQLRNRMKLKSKNLKLPTDIVTSDGLLIRGCIYLKEVSPKNKTTTQIQDNINKEIINKIETVKTELTDIFNKKVFLDVKKARLIVNSKKLYNLYSEIPLEIKEKLDFAIVEEYPTYDGFEVSIDFLN